MHDHHKCKPGPTTHNVSNQLIRVLALNAGFAVIELIGGWWTGSVSIQANAIHDFGDSLVLGTAVGLQILSKSEGNPRFNFGTKRLSLLSALLTSLILIIGSVFVVFSAVNRLANPREIHVTGMLGFAVFGMMINGVAALQLFKGQTQNEKAITWHLIEDLLGWVAVFISSLIMHWSNILWIDPVLSLIVSGIILVGASRNLWTTGLFFLQRAPNIEIKKIKDSLKSVPGILEVKSFRVWTLDGDHHVASIVATIDKTSGDYDNIKTLDIMRAKLSEFGHYDTTIELH